MVARLAKQSHLSPPKDSLAVMILRYYFEGSRGAADRKHLENRLKATGEAGGLGDFPWTSSFEDVLEKYRARLEKLAVEMVIEEVKWLIEREVRDCFGARG